MKKYLLAATLCMGSLFSYNHPCPDNWQVSGDYLYLMPTVDDTYFVLESAATTTFPNGERIQNNFGFHSGYRLGVEYSFCNPEREFQVFYSRLNMEQKKTVAGEFLWATVGRPDMTSSFENYQGTASSNLNLLYQRIDGLFSQQMIDSSGLTLSLTPGLEFAYLRLDEHYAYQVNTGALGVAIQKGKTWGVGPQMGFEFDYDLYKTPFSQQQTDSTAPKNPARHTLSVEGFFSGSILASRSTASNYNSLTGVTLLDVKDQATWRVVPVLHARAGLNYAVHWNRMGLGLGAGYEFSTYIRGRTTTSFPDDVADGLCSTEYYNFDVQGLYVSAAFSF